eukprot:1174930-Pleurochrysis_carterae.AAC.1
MASHGSRSQVDRSEIASTMRLRSAVDRSELASPMRLRSRSHGASACGHMVAATSETAIDASQ